MRPLTGEAKTQIRNKGNHPMRFVIAPLLVPAVTTQPHAAEPKPAGIVFLDRTLLIWNV